MPLVGRCQVKSYPQERNKAVEYKIKWE